MKVTAEIPDLTPQQLAECFWGLDDTQQADFFAALGAEAMARETYWGPVGSYAALDMQMYAAGKRCTPHGRRVMELIGQGVSFDRVQPLHAELDAKMIQGRLESGVTAQ